MSTSRFLATPSAGELAVTAQRCAAQLLCGDPAGSPEEVTRRLLAVQAQDPRGARLAVRARSAGLSAADVDAALARRSLVVSWLNRGTLHLVSAEDYWWLHPLTNPQLRTGSARRLAQEGVPPDDAERGVAALRAALASDPVIGPHRHIVTGNGLFRPFALAGGRAVATWKIAGGRVVLAPFGEIDAGTQAVLDADAAAVLRFLAGEASRAADAAGEAGGSTRKFRPPGTCGISPISGTSQ